MKRFTLISIFFCCLISAFILGIYVANTKWFNNVFYVKSRQMIDLNIKSAMPIEQKLSKAQIQYEMDSTAQELNEHYHNYYKTVVERIKKLDYDEEEKSLLLSYINGYDKRKQEMIKIIFPRLYAPRTDEYAYGSLINAIYPMAQQEFDKQELLRYRFILQNQYNGIPNTELDNLFKE